MFDKEIEALAKCNDLIKDLDNDSKIRVIKYLIEKFGISQTSPSNNLATSNQIMSPNTLTVDTQNTVSNESGEEYPTLKELLVKNYPKNETERILCYAFLASNYGQNTFTKSDIIESYKKNNRFGRNASKNLMQNINSCIKKDWIKDINNNGDDFILKPDGKSYAKEILKGNSTTKEVKRSKKVKPSSNNE